MKKDENLELSKIMDLLEKVFVEYAQNIMEKSGMDINYVQARNLVGKVGIRIIYGETLGKERVDELLTPSLKGASSK